MTDKSKNTGGTISAEQIKVLHETLMLPGHSVTRAAIAAGVARCTALAIKQGKYKLSEQAQAEWNRTFGATQPAFTFGPHLDAAKIKAAHHVIHHQGGTLEDAKALTGLSLGTLDDLVKGTKWFRTPDTHDAWCQTFGLHTDKTAGQ